MSLSRTFINNSKFCLSRVVVTAPTIFNSRQTFPLVYQTQNVHRKSIYKHEEAKKLRVYFLTRYVEYLKNYDKVIEKNFPATMQTYRVFKEGFNSFLTDTKYYFKIVGLLYTPGYNFRKLLRREIELYDQMPKDMRKVLPILILTPLPFGFYVVLPLIYTFPKHLLSPHFWTLEQRSTFNIEYLKNRLIHNKPVLRHLQGQLDYLKGSELYEPWSKVLGKLGSGLHPTVDEILVCKELFTALPYNLYYLSRNHVKHLIKMHDLHSGWFRRTRLAERARILVEMDRAIMREGGVHNLPIEALRNACYIRGLNPTNMKTDDMIQWLTNWIKISSHIDKDNASLLLHCPVLLAYNEPSNWRLIYPAKDPC